jgi:hypothetical protein
MLRRLPAGSGPPVNIGDQEMGIVWVAHPVRDDISAAQEWGSLFYVNDRYVYGDELTSDNRIPRQFERAMVAAARKFDPDNDFLLLVGDHVQVTYLAFMLSRVHGRCTALRFDRKAGGYFRVRLEDPLQVLAEQDLTGIADI